VSNTSTTQNLIDTAFGLFELLIFARIILTWLPVSPWNPVARWLRRIVDPILRPFRRLLPSFSGMDFSPLLALLVIYAANRVVDSLVGGPGVSATATVLGIVRQLVLTIIVVFDIVLFVRLVFSFFHADPWHPMVMGVRRISDPVVRPFAGVVPRTAGMDSAAAVAFLVFLVLYFVGAAFFSTVGAH
jgi:YggT family protein